MMSFRFKSSDARHRNPRRSAAVAIDDIIPPEPAEAAEGMGEVSAKGWYSSSLELRLGLDVMEDVAVDELPPELAASFRQR